MCIIGCGPKMKLIDLYGAIRDGIVDLDNYNNKGIYEIDQIKLSFDKLKEIIDKDPDNWQVNIQNYIRELIKDVNLEVEDHIYQGCIVYAKGKTPETALLEHIITAINFGVYYGREDIVDDEIRSLRPTELKLFADWEEGLDLRLLFIFSHENRIKSYLYQRPDWLYVLNYESSKKYLFYQNRDDEFWDDGVQVFKLKKLDDEFIDKISKDMELTHTIAIVCENKEVFEKIMKEKKVLSMKREIIGI